MSVKNPENTDRLGRKDSKNYKINVDDEADDRPDFADSGPPKGDTRQTLNFSKNYLIS